MNDTADLFANATTDAVVRLRDGRALAFAEYGDPAGPPVMFFHGLPGSRISAAVAHAAASGRGIRVIAPDRPGFGRSTFLRGRKILDWPDDAAQLADALWFEKFGVIGVSGGGPYAAACAYAMPQRLTGVAIVSGIGPLHGRNATRGMMRTNRILFGVTRRFPAAGRVFMWLMGSMAKRASESTMERFLSAMPPADRAVVSRPEVRSILLRDLKEAFRSGSRGAARDNALVVRPWGFRLADIRAAVHVWQGGADRNVPPAHGKHQAAAIPGATLHFSEDEGHLLIVDRIGEILQSITAAPAR